MSGGTRTSGRPAGTETTRAAILEAATAAFADAGFDGTSVRAVAVRAGVDPSTVLHFFASKDGLFSAVISEAKPASLPLAQAFARRAPGEELVALYLRIWEEGAGSSVQALMRAGLGSVRAAELLREYLMQQLLAAAPSDDPLGVELCLTHLVGLALGRHVVRLPALVGASVEQIAARVGPVLDAYRSR